VFSNSAGYATTAVIGFLLAPLVVHALGNTGYGLWTLILSLTGYFGLLDLGIRSSVGRFVARYLALNDEDSLNRTVSTAVLVLSCCGLLALTASLIVALIFFDAFHVAIHYRSAARLALVITGVNVTCILPLSVFSAVLIGLERFDIVSGISIVSEVVRAVLVVIALKFGGELVALALISLLMTAIQYSAMIAFAKALHRRLRVRLGLVDMATVRRLFGFSVFRFIWIVANQLIFYSDSIVIGAFLGAAAITPFAIAGSLINYGRNVVSLVTDTLAPSASRMDAVADVNGLRRLLVIGTRISLAIAVPLCIGYFFLGGHFIGLWMGKAYVSSAVFLAVLTIPQITSMSQYTSALILAGMARHRALAYLAITEGIANLALSIVLVQKYGLIGVAWGTVIPNVVLNGVVVPIYTLGVLQMSAWEYIRRAFVRPLACGIPAALLAFGFWRLGDTVSWFVFLIEAAGVTAVFAGCAYFIGLERTERSRLVTNVNIILRREVAAHEA
jgi:O-antigen/teichoic acid export membrane protein